MNVTESSDLNTLLSWLTQLQAAGNTATSGKALQAAQRLAARANKTLSAGIQPGQLLHCWPQLTRSPAQAAAIKKARK